MNKASGTAILALSLILMSSAAMAQLRDNNIPAGADILSGTPSGTSSGSLSPRTVPPVGYVPPAKTGRSSGCDVGCAPIIVPNKARRGME